MRRSYEQSFAELSEAANVVGEPRPAPSRPPRHDDPEPGPSLLHAELEGVDFLDLTLPGLFMTHCQLRGVSFTGSDLRLSTLHWTDFAHCDFSGCDLSQADLRGCTFEDCSFAAADLQSADLRHASFARCDMQHARLGGARLSREQAELLGLAADQLAGVHWQDDGNTELPPG